jgi:hypothetical protein
VALLAAAFALFAPGPTRAADPAVLETVTIEGETHRFASEDKLRAWGLDTLAIPPERNAAWTYLRAFEAMKYYPEDDFDDTWGHVWSHGYNGEFPLVDAWLDKNARAIGLLHKAGAMPECRFPLSDGEAVVLLANPHLNAARMAGKMLSADAARHVARGRHREAVRSLEAIFRLARHSGDGGFLIDNLVGRSIFVLGHSRLIDVVGRHGLSSTHLARVADLLRQYRDTCPRMKEVMRREKLFGEQAGEEVWAGKFDETVDELMGNDLLKNFDFPIPLGARPEVRPLRAAIGVDGVRALLPDRTLGRYYETLFDRLFALAERPAWELARGADPQVLLAEAPEWAVDVRDSFRMIGGAFCGLGYERVRLDLTEVYVAVLRYRKTNKTLPRELADLVPRYLPALPKDEWDRKGRPLRYSRTNDPAGFVVYSIGPNEKDDGGKVLTANLVKTDGDQGLAWPPPPLPGHRPQD